MVHKDYNTALKGPYQEIKKDKPISKMPSTSSAYKNSGKNDKNNPWGPVFKNKQNFIDMHIF